MDLIERDHPDLSWDIEMPAIAEFETTANSTSITSDALGLLDKFDSQIGDVVYAIAEEYARERCHDLAVEITTDDVRNAGELVIAGLQRMVEVGKLWPSFTSNLEAVRNHFRGPVR